MNLLLLTDALDVSDTLRAGLAAHGHSVAWSLHPPAQALHDGWIVDADMSGAHGLAWLRDRRRSGAETPAIVIGHTTLDAHEAEALRLSPADLLAKPIDADTVAARVAAWPERIADGTTLQAGELSIVLERRSVTRDGLPVTLTAREWELFERLVQRAGRVVPRGELELLVARPDGAPSSNAIEVHLSAIRRKIGRHAVETIRGRGYRLKL